MNFGRPNSLRTLCVGKLNDLQKLRLEGSPGLKFGCAFLFWQSVVGERIMLKEKFLKVEDCLLSNVRPSVRLRVYF